MAMVEQVLRNEKKLTKLDVTQLSNLSVQELNSLIDKVGHTETDALEKLRKYAQLPKVAEHVSVFKRLRQINDVELQNALLKNTHVMELQARLRKTQRKSD
ncbi:MAG: hypothetical protein KGH54_01885 [Candidatus Micrarchaeota archaeon]|nr:hypothetical protein [Candidatus Micrarchaeota archaeon]